MSENGTTLTVDINVRPSRVLLIFLYNGTIDLSISVRKQVLQPDIEGRYAGMDVQGTNDPLTSWCSETTGTAPRGVASSWLWPPADACGGRLLR